jgi:membrane fusion protein (multidrug efflux system)
MSVHSRTLFASLALSCSILPGCADDVPPPPTTTPAVTYVTLETRPVTLTRELPGRTSAYVMAEVRPQVTGIVQERLFEEGALVTEGQPLYQLDDATYRAAWNSAKASLARAQATVEVARLNAERAQELIKVDAISRQAYDDAMAALRQAEADVGVAEAQVTSTAVELRYARISSPIDGRIGKSTVTRGALVTADQAQPLTTVQQLDPIYVDLNQSSSELLELRRELANNTVRRAEGVPVAILLEDGTEYEYEGELTFSDVAVDPMTGSYALRTIVPNPDQLLMPGMYVRALISNAILDEGLLVPQQGIARDPKGNASAMVINGDNEVEQRTVNLRRAVGDDWLVSDGLSAGDRVIVEGLQKIRPGIQVQGSEVALNDRDLEPDDSGVFEPDAAAAPSAAADSNRR